MTKVPLFRKELLSRMRGRRSQSAVSRALGFTMNQVYRWESGATRFYWRDFVELCRVLKMPLRDALERAFDFRQPPNDDAALLKHLLGGRPLVRSAEALGVSRFKLQRWIKGQAKVPFDSIMLILDHTDLLVLFVERLVDPDSIASLAHRVRQRRALRELFFQRPVFSAAVLALDLDDYQRSPTHDSRWISEQVGVSVDDVEAALSLALNAGIVRRVHEKYVLSNNNIRTRGLPDLEYALHDFWIHRGLDREKAALASGPNSKDHFNFLLLSVNESQEREIREVVEECGNRLLAIASSPAEGIDRIKIFNLQYFSAR